VASLLILAGLADGQAVTSFQGLELLGLAILAADAWGVRQRTPVLNSKDKAVAAGGWSLLILAAVGLALALPVL
jgi:hypothetical protein